MKKGGNEAMRELRRIIGRTQGEFAAMIGASKDAVASWETGRNPLSEPFARRIAFATGAEAKALRRGRGRLMYYEPFAGRRPFTAETFERYRRTYWGRSDEQAAREHLEQCTDALGLIFRAAAKAGGRVRYRLPAVVDSFIQWCQQTRLDFKLERPIDEELWQRRTKVTLSHPYGQWRQMQKEDPAVCRVMGFKDDPRKGDGENLILTAEMMPIWWPGRWMRRPRETR